MKLYRGKRIDNGEWVYGYYYCDHLSDAFTNRSDSHLIYPRKGEQACVLPSTVGQSTGLKDIYAGTLLNINNNPKIQWLVEWRDLKWMVTEWPYDQENEPPNSYDLCDVTGIKIIGTIHDTTGGNDND